MKKFPPNNVKLFLKAAVYNIWQSNPYNGLNRQVYDLISLMNNIILDPGDYILSRFIVSYIMIRYVV